MNSLACEPMHSRSPIKRIIFLIERPFTERNYQRWGIELLQKNGFEVEVWDFTPFLHPRVYHNVRIPDPMSFGGYHRFLTQQKALDAISRLTPSCFGVCSPNYQYGSFPVYRALSKIQLRYCVVVANAVPVLGAVQNPVSILDRITRASFAEWLNALFTRIPFRYLGIRPAEVLLAGGVESVLQRCKYPMDRETVILWSHTRDYDLYLEEKDKPIAVDRHMGVFLDEYLPFHPDYVHVGMPPPSGPDSYFPALRRLFDHLEREYGVRIVVAAHPSSEYEKHPDYFGGRPIVKGKTMELIRQAGFAIAHESTALNFAVMFSKPVLFVTTDEIERNPREARFIHAMAAWLNKTAINADAPLQLDWNRELMVDHDAYARYGDAFIKKSGSPEKPAWQILADYLKAQ